MTTVFTRVRSRTRENVMKVHEVSQRWSTPKWSEPPTAFYGRVVGSITQETISDLKPSGSGRYGENPCCHQKRSGAFLFGNYGELRSQGEFWSEGQRPYGQVFAWIGAVGTMPKGVRPDLAADILEEIDPAALATQGIPFLKEFRQTVDMIRNPFSFLASLPRGRRHTTLGKHLRNLGLGPTSSAWLQYNYGWKPLMMDLGSIAETLGSLDRSYDQYVSGTDWVKRQKSAVYASGKAVEMGGTGIELKETQYTKRAKVTMRVRVLPARDTAAMMSKPAFLAKKLGFSLDALPAAAWEMVPYSFVADWFLPVGDMLSKVRHTPCDFQTDRVSYHDTVGYESMLWKWTYGRSSHGKTEFPVGKSSPVLTESNFTYNRNVDGIGPEGVPLISAQLSTSRSLSALSLIAQRLMMPISRR